MRATEMDIQKLEELYAGRRAFFGDLHNHADTSDRSDGKRPLSHWRGALEALKMDFAAILDHGQVEHMYKPEWEDGLFVGGTEPGTNILDFKGESGYMHYNMIFADAKPLEELLEAFPEFEFTGGIFGRFRYPDFTTERFAELVDYVLAHDGFFVHPHPAQLMRSEDPRDYVFREHTGLEVFYGNLRNDYTKANYQLWMSILACGLKVYATGGNDNHACAADTALTCIYAEEKSNRAYITCLREGDVVCGSVGIRMVVNETRMGGTCDFRGGRLVWSVQDFHPSVKNPEHTYRVELWDHNGVVMSQEILCDQPSYFAVDTDPKAKFYRVEVIDVNTGYRIALGNPIWNHE